MKRFAKGSGCYTCRCCGKRTRETGQSESGCDLCLACYEDAGLENEHYDTHGSEPDSSCKYCVEEGKTYNELESVSITLPTFKTDWTSEEKAALREAVLQALCATHVRDLLDPEKDAVALEIIEAALTH